MLHLQNVLFAEICLCEHANYIVRPKHLDRHERYIRNLFVYSCMSVVELFNQTDAFQHNNIDVAECVTS